MTYLKWKKNLYKSIDPVFFLIDDFEGTEDDLQIYKAYSAVQDLRLYLEEKEDKPC